MPLRNVPACLSLLAIAAAMPATALAQTAPARPDAPRPPLVWRQSPQTPPPRPGLAWDNRPVLRFGAVELSLRARLQGDHRSSAAAFLEDGESAFEWIRKRVGVEGNIGDGVLTFEIERELTSEEPWRDVFVNYGQFQAVQVRAGKFKLPFSLEENTSIANIDFAYRSLAARYLAPGRDRGVMVHGRVLARIVRYEVGTFAHDGDNAHSPGSERVRGNRTGVARVQIQPLRQLGGAAADLQVGAGWARSDLDEGVPAVRGRTAFEQTYFGSDYPVLGHRTRTGLELRWRPGPFSIKSEIIRLSDDRREQSVEDTDLSPVRAIGWYFSGSWVITGEAKEDGVNPRRPVHQGGAGAVEVAARLEELRFESGEATEEPSTSPRAEVIVGNANRSSTLGVTWYLNRWVKMQFNLIRETLRDPLQGPLPETPTYWSRVFRIQFIL